jgi:hypothetical protein
MEYWHVGQMALGDLLWSRLIALPHRRRSPSYRHHKPLTSGGTHYGRQFALKADFALHLLQLIRMVVESLVVLCDYIRWIKRLAICLGRSKLTRLTKYLVLVPIADRLQEQLSVCLEPQNYFEDGEVSRIVHSSQCWQLLSCREIETTTLGSLVKARRNIRAYGPEMA